MTGEKRAITFLFISVVLLCSLLLLFSDSSIVPEEIKKSPSPSRISIPLTNNDYIQEHYCVIASATVKHSRLQVTTLIYSWKKNIFSDCLPINYESFKQINQFENRYPMSWKDSIFSLLSTHFQNQQEVISAQIPSKKKPLLFVYTHDISEYHMGSSTRGIASHISNIDYYQVFNQTQQFRHISTSEKSLFYNIALNTLTYLDKRIKIKGEIYKERWSHQLIPDSFVPDENALFPISILDVGEENSFFTIPNFLEKGGLEDAKLRYPVFSHFQKNDIFYVELDGFGLTSSRRKYLSNLVNINSPTSIQDPCLNTGAKYVQNTNNSNFLITGSASLNECKTQILRLISNNCDGDNCDSLISSLNTHFLFNNNLIVSFKNAYQFVNFLDINGYLDHHKLKEQIRYFFAQDWNTLRYSYPNHSEEELRQKGFELVLYSALLGSNDRFIGFAEYLGNYKEIWELGAFLYEVRDACYSGVL